MDHARLLLKLCPALLLAGCDSGSEGGGQAGIAASSTPPHGGVDVTIGSVRYSYDPRQLTAAEVLLVMPPSRDEQIWVTKLIPASRAAALGQDSCVYTLSGKTETCTTQKEPGLMLALLERPLEDYRQAFLKEGLGARLAGAQLDDSRGFSFTEQADGARTEYMFLPVNERTLLVAQQFVPEDSQGTEAIQHVIRTLEAGLEATNR